MLVLLLVPSSPLSAQTPCADCFDAAEAESRKCFGNAISADDKSGCLETRQTRMKNCNEDLCKEVREEHTTATEPQPVPARPGFGAYVPTEGEWLALVMRTGLRREATPDRPYSLDIVLADPQTIEIVVHHAPTMKRDQVNKTIEAAREAIRSQARSHGWDKWVKIREKVEVSPGKK